jgi:hypothetical protein
MARQSTPPVTCTPLRSAGAARAHAANKVTWTIDLAQASTRITEQAVVASNRQGIALGLLAAVIWSYDIVRIAAR